MNRGSLKKESRIWFDRALIGMILADGQVVEPEKKLLDQMIRQDDPDRELSEWEYLKRCLDSRKIPELPNLVLDEETAWDLLRMLALVAVSDFDLDMREEMYLFQLGEKLGFSQSMTRYTLQWALSMTGLRHPSSKQGAAPKPDAGSSPQLIAVLWRMAPALRVSDLLKQAARFLKAAKAYSPDLVVFPDFFSDAFLRRLNTLSDDERQVLLGRSLTQVREYLTTWAEQENLNIYAGNLQVREWKSYFDLMVLCRRDGSWEERVHTSIAAHDGLLWQPDSAVHVLRTDLGCIGVLSHHPGDIDPQQVVADRNLDLLLVPHWPSSDQEDSAPVLQQEMQFYSVLSGQIPDEKHRFSTEHPEVGLFTETDAVFPHLQPPQNEREAELCATLDLDLLRQYQNHEELPVGNVSDNVRFYRVNWLTRNS